MNTYRVHSKMEEEKLLKEDETRKIELDAI